MALDQLRPRITALLDPFVAKLGWVNPNYISWFSLFIAAISAWLFATATADASGGMNILIATILYAFAALCDGLDGQIARKHGKDSAYGDYLDHTIDRIVDVGIIVAIGINVSWVSTPHLGYIAGLATLMGSYMGTQAQSVGLGRNYRGFGRADRMIVTIAGALVASWQAFSGVSDYGEIPFFGVKINALTVVLVITLLGGVYTFLTRFISASKELLSDSTAP